MTTMDFAEELLASSQKSGVSPEMLETLGNKAAMAFLQSGTPLNDAVKGLVSEHGELNNEHIKRIVEFANNRTFKELFDKSEDKHVHFGVADPGAVIQDLSNGGSPAHAGKQSFSSTKDYDAPPTERQEFTDPNFLSQGNMGGQPGQSGQIEKVASTALPVDYEGHSNPIEDVYAVHLKLQASQEHLREANESYDGLLKMAQEDFYNLVKSESLRGNGLGVPGVMDALTQLGHDPAFVKVALRSASLRLLGEGVDFDHQNGTFFEKTAMRVPNPDHPINQCFCGLIKAAEDKVQTELALADVAAGLVRTESFLQDVGRGPQ